MNKELEKIWLDPRHPASFSGARNLQDLYKGKKKKLKVLEWLKTSDIFTLHRPARRKFPRRHYNLGAIFELWECDLSDVHQMKDSNNGTTFLLFVIDAVSKRLWVEPLKSKKPEAIVAALKKIFASCAPHLPYLIQTDGGKEFTGSVTQKYLKSLGIRFRVARSPTIKCSYAERVQRTIKERMQRYLEHNNTKKYINVLQDLVYAYNHRVHSATKMRPADVTFKNAHKAIANIRKKYPDPPSKKPKYKVNDLVRISRERGTFEKGYTANFTEEIYRISKVDTSQTPHIYELKDQRNEPILGSFYEYELSKVIKDLKNAEFIVEKILQRRGTGKKAEVLVRWAGYSKDFDSWEPVSAIRDVAQG